MPSAWAAAVTLATISSALAPPSELPGVDVEDGLGTSPRRAWIELERSVGDVCARKVRLRAQRGEGLFETALADVAPRADDVRVDLDLEGRAHAAHASGGGGRRFWGRNADRNVCIGDPESVELARGANGAAGHGQHGVAVGFDAMTHRSALRKIVVDVGGSETEHDQAVAFWEARDGADADSVRPTSRVSRRRPPGNGDRPARPATRQRAEPRPRRHPQRRRRRGGRPPRATRRPAGRGPRALDRDA